MRYIFPAVDRNAQHSDTRGNLTWFTRFLVLLMIVLLGSCKDEDEMMIQEQCEIGEFYNAINNTTYAGDVFNIGGDDVRLINNDRLEFVFVYDYHDQYFSDDMISSAMDVVWLNAILFVDSFSCKIKTGRNRDIISFEYDTMGCDISFRNEEYALFGHFNESGQELELNRYAVYSHVKTSGGRDSFAFLLNLDWNVGSTKDAATACKDLGLQTSDTIFIQHIENEFTVAQ